jgi:DNA processing protein
MLGVGVGGPLATGAMTAVAVPAAGPHHVTEEPEVDPYGVERDAWAVIAGIDGLGPVALSALLAAFGSGRAVLTAAAEPDAIGRLVATPPLEAPPGRERRRPVSEGVATAIVEATQCSGALLERLRSLGLTVVTMEEPTYPRRLTEIAMPPHLLFVQGALPALSHRRAVAVVGTRRATTRGRTTAGRIATALVAGDAAVISGLAYGIDGAAHAAALRAGGITVAVIGGGHAVSVPPAHDRLARSILDNGGAVVSEFAPDAVPTRGTFPRRNRIISGLADATVVVEAPARSGALITASWALEQGRGCFLVPGPLDALASAGCLSFLREFHGEARVVSGIPQLIADLGLGTRAAMGTADAVVGSAVQDLGATGRQVATALLDGHATVDELVAVTDLAVATVLASLAILEGRGLVAGVHGRYRPDGALLGERVTPKLR